MDLQLINGPEDIKKKDIKELEELAQDIRDFLIESVSTTGGHLSSNLGIVELTIAMHYVFNSPNDIFLFDVGHQSYVHKILTGRAKYFSTLRQYQGLSGFQKREESVHDRWEAGHSSTSLSAALGFSIARDLNHEHYQVLPVIGDGSLMNGMSMEALNQIGGLQPNMIIVFNDNNMSINKNVGGLSNTLTKLRTSKGYTVLKHDIAESLKKMFSGDKVVDRLKEIKEGVKANVVDSSIFGEFDIDYLGPVDGHDLKSLIKTFEIAKKHQGPIVVHVLTTKGKGYEHAENDEAGKWHGVSKFDIETGEPLTQLPSNQKAWSSIISDYLMELAKHDQDIVAISPAMVSGSKLEKFFEAYPTRSFDCGIAEEHATTFAAALSQAGKKPFLSIYSSFLQRAYDQINHDICRMKLPVVIGIDRAGLVGEDGDTHHGVFDVSILNGLPNMVIAQPKNAKEAQELMNLAFTDQTNCFAIRYPRGATTIYEGTHDVIEVGTWSSSGEASFKGLLITYGPQIEAIESYVKAQGLPIRIINARFIKPLDHHMLDQIAAMKLPIVIYETDILKGGLGSSILEYYNDQGIHDVMIKRIGIGDHFVPHGSLKDLYAHEHISYVDAIEELVKLCD